MLIDMLVKRAPIEKSFSCDRKFCAETADGMKYFLRISPPHQYDGRRALFELLNRLEEFPMCKPVEIGTCGEGVYTLYTWINGIDAEEAIPLLSDAKQYELGFEAGELLKKIHSIPAPKGQEDWHTRFNRKTDIKIKKYRECGFRFEGDERIIEYLAAHRDIFKNRPQCFQHGDYHIGNMMLENGKLILIDFDRFDFGDPWEEFNRIVWCAQAAPPFAAGMIDGYFDANPPENFWRCLTFYIGSNTLSSIYWAIDYGQGVMEIMLKQAQDVLSWYDNMQTVVPSWYPFCSTN